MKIRSALELFDDLINLNADEWNTKLAKELGMTLDELKFAFIMRDKIAITEDRVKLDVYKIQIQQSGSVQKDKDTENLDNYNNSDTQNQRDKILHKPTKLDRYTIRVNDSDTIIDSIACTGKIIVGMDFSKAELADSYFCHCIFYNCDFREANLTENTFQSCIFNSCSFLKADFMNSIVSKGLFIDCNLDNTTFDCSFITDTPFIASQLNFSSFMQATLLNSGFTDCDLMHSQLIDSKHVSCSWTQCNFTDAKFKRSRLTDLIIVKADMTGCDFDLSLVSCLTLSECKYNEKYAELFKMNHLLFSPSVMEWEQPEKEAEDDKQNDGNDDKGPDDFNGEGPGFDSNYGED